jgi:hypothetical protein
LPQQALLEQQELLQALLAIRVRRESLALRQLQLVA